MNAHSVIVPSIAPSIIVSAEIGLMITELLYERVIRCVYDCCNNTLHSSSKSKSPYSRLIGYSIVTRRIDLDTLKALRATCRGFDFGVQFVLKNTNADFMRSALLNNLIINTRLLQRFGYTIIKCYSDYIQLENKAKRKQDNITPNLTYNVTLALPAHDASYDGDI